MQTIKCVGGGGDAFGKTCLLIATQQTNFHRNCTNYAVTVMIGGEPYTLGLFDTAGQKDYDRLQQLNYLQTGVFLVCFSVVSPSSFENVAETWVLEIAHHCPKTPFLLVGTQIDLRDDPSAIEKLAKNKQKCITPENAEKLARGRKALKFVECSALTQKGLKKCLMKQYWLPSSLQNRRRATAVCCYERIEHLQSSFCPAGVVIILKAMFKSN